MEGVHVAGGPGQEVLGKEIPQWVPGAKPW